MMSKYISILLLVAACIFLLIPLLTGQLQVYIFFLPAAVMNLLGAHWFWKKRKHPKKEN